MGTESEIEMMPVFMVNGFLESGKSSFLKFTMEQEYFQADGKTLLIVCEEGEEEYPQELLEQTRTALIVINEPAQLTPAYLEELELLYNPERVLIEWNGMWNPQELRLPPDWEIHQQITVIDGSTLDLYLNNMKALLGNMLKQTELVICNRCDEVADLDRYRRILKAMNNQCEIVFEDEDGEIAEIAEADLPFDLSQDVISISPKAYGIWYLDCMDKPERYEGKVVEFTAMVLKSPELPKNYFVPGRMAMTCCADDMSFLGYVCKAREARKLETRQWVRVRAKIAYELWPDYGDKGPVLYAEEVNPDQPIEAVVEF